MSNPFSFLRGQNCRYLINGNEAHVSFCIFAWKGLLGASCPIELANVGAFSPAVYQLYTLLSYNCTYLALPDS